MFPYRCEPITPQRLRAPRRLLQQGSAASIIAAASHGGFSPWECSMLLPNDDFFPHVFSTSYEDRQSCMCYRYHEPSNSKYNDSHLVQIILPQNNLDTNQTHDHMKSISSAEWMDYVILINYMIFLSMLFSWACIRFLIHLQFGTKRKVHCICLCRDW
jgi:hypothetical protein